MATPTERWCSKCEESKPLTEFRKHAKGRFHKRSICAACTGLAKRRLVLSKYGLTEESYKELSEQQGGVCAVCKLPPTTKRTLDVDHCHSTGKVRGLLCWPCNIAIGHLENLRAPLTSYTTYLGAA